MNLQQQRQESNSAPLGLSSRSHDTERSSQPCYSVWKFYEFHSSLDQNSGNEKSSLIGVLCRVSGLGASKQRLARRTTSIAGSCLERSPATIILAHRLSEIVLKGKFVLIKFRQWTKCIFFNYKSHTRVFLIISAQTNHFDEICGAARKNEACSGLWNERYINLNQEILLNLIIFFSAI